MTHDTITPYQLDQPLTAEEVQLIDILHTVENGESYLQAIDSIGARLEPADGGRLRLVSKHLHTDEVEAVIRQLLLLSQHLRQQGHIQMALGAAGLALRLNILVLSPEHPNMQGCVNELATCLESLGRAGEALPLYQATLEASERVLGPEHPDTLISCNNLASCLDSLGRAGEALPLYQATLEARERVLGPEHLGTLLSMNNLAICLSTLGRVGEALPLYQTTLEVRERVLGPEHPDSLLSMNNLAGYLASLGRVGEALPYTERALATLEQILGPEHPRTLTCRTNLGMNFWALGRAAEALPLLERTLAASERVLGSKHPDSLSCRTGLGVCLRYLGRPSDAISLHKSAMEIRERVFGPEHPDTLVSSHNMAICLYDLGRYDEACSRYEDVVESRNCVLGPEHPDTLASLINLATCLKSLGRAGEALPLYEKTLAVRERVQGAEHPDTLASRGSLATLLYSLGRTGEALPHYQQVLEASTRLLGPEHPNTLISRNNLASCLCSLGQSVEALSMYKATLVVEEKVLGTGHLDTLFCRNNLVECLDSLGRIDEALKQWQAQVKALQLRPQPGGRWLEMLGSCANALSKHSRAGRLSDWDSLFADLSTAMLGVIDLESPEQLEASRAGVAKFFTTYLRLCIDQNRRDLIPKVLAARQSRKLAALVADELEAAGTALDPDSPRGRFQAIRLELRKLALGLRVIEGGAGTPGDEGQRTLDADSAIARQRNQMAAYKAKLDEYRAVRAGLEKSDPDFAVTAAALRPSLEELQAALTAGEGLVLLFEHDDKANDSIRRLALLVSHNNSVMIPLAEQHLNQGAVFSRAWSGQLHTRSGTRRVGSFDRDSTSPVDISSVMVSNAGESLTGVLTLAISDGLWIPLSKHLTGLTHLHVVTHGSWHLLPVELGAPEQITLSIYPGFIYYHRLRHQGTAPGSGAPEYSAQRPSSDSPMGLAVHAAEECPGLEPIPFVYAEANLIKTLWSGQVYTDPDLQAERPVLTTLQLAAHGQADEKDPARANVVLGSQILDFHAVLGARQHPPVVVLSACTVGRTSDDPDGEPLGLVGSFLLKGSRYVIASLQPVPDFYMPLLIALFYQSWIRLGTPDIALAEAKRLFRTGDWYEETEDLIRTHYLPIIEQILTAAIEKPKRVDWHDPVLRLTGAWPFPEPYRALHPDEDQHKLDELREVIKRPTGRIQLANGILDTFIAERDRLPEAIVDTLCTWVRGFGTIGDPVAQSSSMVGDLR